MCSGGCDNHLLDEVTSTLVTKQIGEYFPLSLRWQTIVIHLSSTVVAALDVAQGRSKIRILSERQPGCTPAAIPVTFWLHNLLRILASEHLKIKGA